ncbi:unnamed protein product [marine sediment metagenome]|uniref:Uncharacterized protein n=1 Tax=marine sediment metagenome TaxID=412755 RepID=X1D5G3_9ZZZZ
MRYAKGLADGFHVYDVPYPTMSDAEIIALPVKRIVDDNALLFLWVIDSRIPLIEKIMKAWGFNYVTVGFVWHKTRRDGTGSNANMTQYTRKSCEFCFIGRRGKGMAKQRILDQFHQMIPLAKTVHSEKPKVIRRLIVKMCGDVPRIELFARRKVEGWDCWGNEVESDIEL